MDTVAAPLNWLPDVPGDWAAEIFETARNVIEADGALLPGEDAVLQELAVRCKIGIDHGCPWWGISELVARIQAREPSPDVRDRLLRVALGTSYIDGNQDWREWEIVERVARAAGADPELLAGVDLGVRKDLLRAKLSTLPRPIDAQSLGAQEALVGLNLRQDDLDALAREMNAPQ